jgi:hypothetical protein
MQFKKTIQLYLSLGLFVFSSALFASENSKPLTDEQEQKVIFSDMANATEDFIHDEYDTYRQLGSESTIQATSEVDLLKTDRIHKKFPLPIVKYDRQKQFGGWINIKDDQTCLDTRGLVLKRDSSKQVEVNTSCRVINGDWHDPYTDKNYTSSTDIQIDHMVPLKNAFMSGAYEWTNKKRCLYANYMGNEYHLLSVFGTENMRKGDRSPREYIPPNKKYTCNYLKTWLKIKYIWSLRMTPQETEKISQLIQNENCDRQDFKISQAEVDDQKRFIKSNENLCVGMALTAF